MAKPLEGIRVLDLSRVLAGPWCTQLLADLGADVVKVERPGEGDDTRHWGPPWAGEAGDEDRVAAYYLCANRGKRSAAIDLAKEDGAATVRALAARADVLIENFKTGALVKYGLDQATLRAANPRLVYCSITGFGQDGPYAERAGYDFVIQGMAGLMSVTGAVNGEPAKVGVAISDLLTGLYAANAIQAALLQRHTTGVGQHIDIALFDVQVAAMANQALNYLMSGKNPARHGNAHPNIVPYEAFTTADGAITIAVGNDSLFTRLCQGLSLPEVAVDARFRRNADRGANRAALIPLLQAQFATRTTAHWLEQLEPLGVPAGPINTLEQTFADPQVVHRRLRLDLPHPTLGTVPGVRCPIRMSGAEVGSPLAPPPLGWHTAEVLAELEQSSAGCLVQESP
jgi:crotonobetainyl-CoA:carnitine CoA-transferase CaiB-like acyl-CoA transferase